MLVDERLESIGERMASAARELQDEHDPAATVKSAVDLLVQNVEGCDAASISLVYAKRRVETPAASDDLAATGDRLQQELGEGPALTTLWDEETVYVPDLAADSLSIAFGNFRAGYLIAERTETQILRDPFTHKPFVHFYATKRLGGQVTNSEAIKLLKFAV